MLKSLLGHSDRGTVEQLEAIEYKLNQILLGKPEQVRLCLCCALARGHLLVEDHPGLGKTTLAKALAAVLGLPYSRIQFTSDMLPADVVGVSIYDEDARSFRFHKGPIFNALILADEINRASPKAQSALLEAMEEQRVSVDGESWELPQPFFVIATQNPHDQAGTFPLPESQLDRFMMTLTLGYPDQSEEQALLLGTSRRVMIDEVEAEMDSSGFIELQSVVDEIHVSDDLAAYVVNILNASRNAQWIPNGLSPRTGLALVQAARAWALLEGRRAVIPEDMQHVLPAVVGHRLAQNMQPSERAQAAARLLAEVNLN